ncbi:alpha/beta hydrolase [Alcaligenes sp. A-TC2]|uniref:alpha/beta fold hydrolase n=1 Tax=Alcaligenes TaxID=507 RepID=UPI0020A6E759|nr:alpha/beta hydrolase [Alcaligenes sp. 1735tsa3]MCX5471512.1 alpha/beta hydrolase [Alcaligenes nematophilus]USY25986.1 alpha/beta hydrolase [Alcaligenes sp. 1735tsa3]
MSELSHHYIEVNRVRLHYVEAGSGPAVIFCHGFPELWYSWRHQLPALAKTGYRAIALDMRGHGESEAPAEVGSYGVMQTVGDVIGLMDALGIEKAVMVGHDAGTSTAYHTALMRPDRVRGVMGLSVPYIPRGDLSILEAFEGAVPPGFYMQYFQAPGVADHDLERDVKRSLRRLIYANSGLNPQAPFLMLVPGGGTLVDTLPEPEDAMSFLSEDDLDVYAAAYKRSGFRGGLNGYRVFQRNWEDTAAWNGMALPVPAAYVGGNLDTVLQFPGFREAAQAMGQAIFLDGAGHWIQTERAQEVNTALLSFLDSLAK